MLNIYLTSPCTAISASRTPSLRPSENDSETAAHLKKVLDDKLARRTLEDECLRQQVIIVSMGGAYMRTKSRYYLGMAQ